MKIEQKKDLTRDYSFLNKIKVGDLSLLYGSFIVFMLNEQLKAQTFIRPTVFQQDIAASWYQGGFNWDRTDYEWQIDEYLNEYGNPKKNSSKFWEDIVTDKEYNLIKKYINENC